MITNRGGPQPGQRSLRTGFLPLTDSKLSPINTPSIPERNNAISLLALSVEVMKTYVAKDTDFSRDWYVVDATEAVLGRLASQVAMRLRGKHKPIFSPHMDTGDFIVVINADKIKLTGRKWEQKNYYRHSGFIGGLKTVNAKKMLDTKPEQLVRNAVRGMLPKNRLGRKLIKKLKVYAGPDHPHAAQNPQPLEITG